MIDDYTPHMFFGKNRNTHRIYMDYASTTPLDKKVLKVMKKILAKNFHNPSSLYKEGVEAKKILEQAREKVARTLKARTEEIFFTGSGTESDNLAIQGVFNFFKKENPERIPHIITSTIEHPAVLETCRQLEKEGAEVSYINPESNGIINISKILPEIKENTILISIMLVNNEIGTIQPIREISRAVHSWKKENGRNKHEAPFLHTDASQAPVYLNVGIEKLGIDLMTLDGSKIYGPKGVGCLYKKHYVNCDPIMFGGGQESGLRPGTENLAQISGFAEAFSLVQDNYEKENKKVTALREYFIEKVLSLSEKVQLNGDREKRIANNVSICISGINAEFSVIQLDERGIACASMTACKNLDDESSSYVVEAINKKECATSTLRFTLGRETKKKDIEKVLNVLKNVIGE